MDLLIGVQVSNVSFELHRVECRKVAKVAAELLTACVALPLMPQEGGLVGTREITLRAVVSEVSLEVSFHVVLTGKDGNAGVMGTPYRRDPVLLRRVSHVSPA